MEKKLKIELRPLGRSGHLISALGLGTVKFGRNQKVSYPGGEGFPLPTEDQIERLLRVAKEDGITYLDTAPAYGISEQRLGEILKKSNLSFQIFTKAGEDFSQGESHYNFSKPSLKASVERSLKRLHKDCLTGVSLHCDSNDLEVLKKYEALEALMELKKEGKCELIGVSTYSVEAGLWLTQMSQIKVDLLMVPFNPGYKNHLSVIEAAKNNGIGILIKKGFSSGHLSSEKINETIKEIMSVDGISSLVLGTTSEHHLKQNITALF